MCGRYAFISGRNVQKTYDLFRSIQNAEEAFKSLPRYNAAPMQRLPVFAVRDNVLTAETMQWWLVPHWSKTNKTEFSTFNAKAETLDKSKLYSPYFKGSRCLIPADAFYEWKKTTTTGNGMSRSGGGWSRTERSKKQGAWSMGQGALRKRKNFC